jgi:Spy/CpxP family protein refolding chaperone
MTKKNGIVLAMILAASLVAGAALAQDAMHEHHHGDMMGMGFFGAPMHDLKALDLTDQQKQQIHTIIKNEHPKIQPLMQDLKGMHQQIESAMDGGSLNQTEALSIIEQHKNTLAQMLVEHASIHSQIMNVLTPEQQQKLKDLKAQHEAQMKQWEAEHQKGGTAPATPPQQ